MYRSGCPLSIVRAPPVSWQADIDALPGKAPGWVLQNGPMMYADATPGHGLEYATVGFQLRAPRVAVVFDGGDDWQVWARAAMREVSSAWAGAGFVLVPHHGGEISPVVAQAVERYDPDFVVAAGQSWRLREKLRPETTRTALGGDPSAGSVAPLGEAEAGPTSDAMRAREWLARHCTPYARFEQGVWDECEFTLSGGPHSQIPSIASLGVTRPPCIAVPGAWGGSIATAAAAVVGVVEEPDVDASASDDEPAVLAFILGAPFRPPPMSFMHSPTGLAMSVILTDQRTALQVTTYGLDRVRSGVDKKRVWVVGPTSDDFALAMILDRSNGHASWIHPSWALDGSGEIGETIHAAAHAHLRDRRPRDFAIASTSLSEEELQPWRDLLDQASSCDPGHEREKRANTIVGEILPTHSPYYHYAATGQHDRRHTVPISRLANGSVELAAALPLPALEADHPLDTADFPLQVDLAVPGAVMPTGRGFDAHCLAGGDLERFQTWIRSGRAGLSFQTTRYDLVLSGATKYGRLATPKLSVAGLGPWVSQMAAQAGYGVVDSDAGRKTDILAQLWGGRYALTSAIASPVREALCLFTPPRQRHDSYLNGDGVRVTAERGVVAFEGLRTAWPADVSDLDVRHALDDLATRRVLRRGLLLQCPECRRLDFIPIENLAQTMQCTLCGSRIPLVQRTWNLPATEPRWFYDAHPAARALITTNSDAPLRLAAHLTRRAKKYAHIGELELVQGGRTVAETDLISLVDDRLSIAEVKTNVDLASGGNLEKAVLKRVLAARILRADEIILATTKAAWPQSTVEAVADAIRNADWYGARPELRLITRLGSVDLVDVATR